MSIDVPYLSDAEIEGEANMLLHSFEAKYGTIQTAATPLDEIIENHLGLGFEITDLGHPAILGQLDIKANLIRVNTVLDPDEDPRKEGRYNYTLAHEGGHQVMHRPYAEALMEEDTLFEEEKSENEEEKNVILCRMEDQRAPIEIQADKFASFLLLPKQKVINKFLEYSGGKHSVEIKRLIPVLRHSRDFRSHCFRDFYQPTDEQLLHYAFKELADEFNVSMQAMIIRLKGLGLLKDPAQEEMVYG